MTDDQGAGVDQWDHPARFSGAHPEVKNHNAGREVTDDVQTVHNQPGDHETPSSAKKWEKNTIRPSKIDWLHVKALMPISMSLFFRYIEITVKELLLQEQRFFDVESSRDD